MALVEVTEATSPPPSGARQRYETATMEALRCALLRRDAAACTYLAARTGPTLLALDDAERALNRARRDLEAALLGES